MTNTDWDNVHKILVEMVNSFNQISPKVLNIAVEITRINSLQWLIGGGLGLLILSGVFAYLANFAWKKLNVKYDERAQVLFIFSIVLSGTSALFAGINLFNVWNWIGVFNPTLALAHEILNQVTGQR